MIIRIKVCMNADEINEAKRKNDFYKQQREANLKKSAKEKVIVPDDVEIPEQEIEIHERLWNPNDIVEAWINEVNKDFISVVHLYSKVNMIIYSDEVWNEIQESFKNRNAKPKRFFF